MYTLLVVRDVVARDGVAVRIILEAYAIHGVADVVACDGVVARIKVDVYAKIVVRTDGIVHESVIV